MRGGAEYRRKKRLFVRVMGWESISSTSCPGSIVSIKLIFIPEYLATHLFGAIRADKSKWSPSLVPNLHPSSSTIHHVSNQSVTIQKYLGVAVIYALSLTTQIASALPSETNNLEARKGCLGGSLNACQQSKAAGCTGQCARGKPRQSLTCLHTCLANAAKSCGEECS